MDTQNTESSGGLPEVVTEYIDAVVRSMGYRRRVREDVRRELEGHFRDALASMEGEQARQERAKEIVKAFGDPKLLGRLIRRGKKRCRPKWLLALIRFGQAVLILLLLCAAYLVWFVQGEPVIRVDYLERLNEVTRPVVAPEDNAWVDYAAAIDLYQDMPEVLGPAPEDMSAYDAFNERVQAAGDLERDLRDAMSTLEAVRADPVILEDLRAWAQANAPAWEAVSRGTRKPYCYRPYSTGEQDRKTLLLAIQLPHLQELKELARVGAWRAREHVQAGRAGEAYEESLATIRLGRHFTSRGTIIEQLVGYSIIHTGTSALLYVLSEFSDDGMTIEQLRAAYQPVAALLPEVQVHMEHMMFRDVVQHTFTLGGPGGGHMIPEQIVSMQDIMGGDAEIPLIATGLSLVHARRDATLAAAGKIYDHMDRVVGMTPYERKENDFASADKLISELPGIRYALLWSLMPALEKVGEIRYRTQAALEAVDTILAAQQYRRKTGEYPTSLTVLQDAGLLDHLPNDPYAPGPLTYRRTEAGFTLYSLGEDFEDDGGALPKGDLWGRGRRREEPDGDRVFWPLPSMEPEPSEPSGETKLVVPN